MAFYFLFNQGEGYSTLLMGMGVYHQLFSNMFDTTTLLFYSYKLSYWLYKKGNNWFLHDATFHINISISKNDFHHFPSLAATLRNHSEIRVYHGSRTLLLYSQQGHAFFVLTFHACIIKRTLKAQTYRSIFVVPTSFHTKLDTYLLLHLVLQFLCPPSPYELAWLRWALANAQLKLNQWMT